MAQDFYDKCVQTLLQITAVLLLQRGTRFITWCYRYYKVVHKAYQIKAY